MNICKYSYLTMIRRADMKKLTLLILLTALVGCSKYSSYDDCYEKNMSKMPEDLKLIIHERQNFTSAVEGLCEKYK